VFGVLGTKTLFVLVILFGFGRGQTFCTTLLLNILFRRRDLAFATCRTEILFTVLLRSEKTSGFFKAPFLLLSFCLVQAHFIIVKLYFFACSTFFAAFFGLGFIFVIVFFWLFIWLFN